MAAPGSGTTVTEESLRTVTPDVVQPDALGAGGCDINKATRGEGT